MVLDYWSFMKSGFLSILSLVFAGVVFAQDEASLPQLPRPVIVAKSLAEKLVKIESDNFVPFALDPEKAIDHFLLFFSASWSPTCKKFTPVLTKFYNDAKAAGANFEIVFVSFDESERAMREYMMEQQMPWPALRFNALDEVDFIKQASGRGVPCLAALDSHGLVLAHSYRQRKKYIGVEIPLGDFAKLIGASQVLSLDSPKSKSPKQEDQSK